MRQIVFYYTCACVCAYVRVCAHLRREWEGQRAERVEIGGGRVLGGRASALAVGGQHAGLVWSARAARRLCTGRACGLLRLRLRLSDVLGLGLQLRDGLEARERAGRRYVPPLRALVLH